jgi:hypothetical protein
MLSTGHTDESVAFRCGYLMGHGNFSSKIRGHRQNRLHYLPASKRLGPSTQFSGRAVSSSYSNSTPPNAISARFHMYSLGIYEYCESHNNGNLGNSVAIN